MSFWDRLAHGFGLEPRRQRPARAMARGFAAAEGGRLTADWLTSGFSADAEIQGSLPRLRNRARSMGRDTPFVPQLKRLLRDNMVGPAGIQLQMRVARLRDGGLDEVINTEIETAWRMWGRADSCDVAGQKSWLDFQWQAAMAPVESGELIFRFVRRAFGKGNQIPLALEAIESDQLDLNYAGALSASGNRWRMGIELNQWGRPVNYAILTRHPGDYLTTGQSLAQGRHEIVPAADIIHVFLPERVGQSRGVPLVAPVMADAHQLDGYEQAATIRARLAAALMGFIIPADGDLQGDAVLDDQRVMDFEAGIYRRLNPGDQVQLPQVNAPDNQLEMFARQKTRRFAAGTGVSYASLSRDASQANYSSQRQEYLQDQDSWSVLQSMLIQRLHQRVFEEWLPLAVLAGAVRINDYEIRRDRYLSAAQWQPRGWAWVDPKKEAEANVISEQAGYTSKTQIVTKLGTTYEQILKDKANERQLEQQYGVQIAAPQIQPDQPDANA
ncbi:MAG: phage portal protein [Caulobacteraceae bacterium]|nr:phage portal protein [Caulobacteraceae bacterium]